MEEVDFEKRREFEKNRIRVSVLLPLWFVAILWLIQFFQWGFRIDLGFLGIAPRTLSGLRGILFCPLIHGSWGHIAGNTLPLLVLGFMMIYFYHFIAYRIIILIWLLDGIGVWLIGRESYHIGASGLIYGMASFLFFSGLIRKNRKLLAVSLAVVFIYGSMIWGLFPYLLEVSWEAHLMGFVAGIGLAIYYRKLGPEDDPVPEWMNEPEMLEDEPEKKDYPRPFQQDWSNDVPVFRNDKDEESD